MLLSLLRKAVEDAGFDIVMGEDAEWTRVGVSGVEGHVWVVPAGKGAILALGPGVATSEFETVTWTDVPLPPGAVRAARFRSPAELYDALRRELLSNVVDRGLIRRRPSARLDLAAPA